MKYNTQEVAALQPDYLGFIFYNKSKRYFQELSIPALPDGIKKVGVFVDASLAFAQAHITKHQLDIVQLHGSESPAYIKELKSALLAPEKGCSKEIWKVFSIKDTFNFNQLTPYEGLVDAFLFDTKGKEKGGNGYTFDWSVLQTYPSQTPFILSGGIGLDQVVEIKEICNTHLPIIGVDVNSRFEAKPGLKDISKLRTFVNELRPIQIQNTSAKAEDS